VVSTVMFSLECGRCSSQTFKFKVQPGMLQKGRPFFFVNSKQSDNVGTSMITNINNL